MRTRLFLLALLVAGCNSRPSTGSADTDSERAVAARADEIRAEADAEVNRQISEIEDAAEAEQADEPAVAEDGR